MKTYERKRQKHREIEGVEELCRLCLDKVDEGVPIFNSGQDVCAAVAMRIMICVGLEMKQEDSLPKIICPKCYEELEKYYKFRKKCEVSYQKLKSHMIALQQKDSEEPVRPEETSDPSVYDKPIIESPPKEKQLLDKEEETAEDQKTDQSSDTNEKIVTEELQIPIQAEANPDIGTFLTSVLTELGILEAAGSNLVLRDKGITSFELEMGDDEQLMVELVEEDDDVPIEEKNDIEPSTQVSPILNKKEPAVVKDGKPKQKNRNGGSKMPGPWCPVCGRVFSSASAAARHAAGHGGARPHACATCGRAFQQKAVLDRHMLVHQEVRPHACPRCPKSFTQRGALAAHARAHAGAARALRLHRCAACDKVFLYASGLSRHMAYHTGREFPCRSCERSFKDHSSLRRHLINFKHGT